MKKEKLVFSCFFVLSLALFLAPIPSGQAGKWGLDKLVHLAIFAMLMSSGFRAFPGAWVLLTVLLIFYGPGIEIFQSSLLDDRIFDYRDIAFDWLGLGLAWSMQKFSKS